MQSLRLARIVMSVGATAAMVAACNGSGGSNDVTPLGLEALAHQKTYHYTGKEQYFKIPSGVTIVNVVVVGAGGGDSGNGRAHGRGGRVTATIPVVPGETLALFVGGVGSQPAGGFNGGGAGSAYGYSASYGGGGASDVREGGERLSDRVVVAGGGGGQGGDDDYRCGIFGRGGKGGGRVAGSGKRGYAPGCTPSEESWAGGGGNGGMQTRGGAGGSSGRGERGSGHAGQDGARGTGGAGGYGCDGTSCMDYGGSGGGGGGGYFGGGGGGTGGGGVSENPGGGGGGGGSSYIEPSAKTFRSWKAWPNATGNGNVTFTW